MKKHSLTLAAVMFATVFAGTFACAAPSPVDQAIQQKNSGNLSAAASTLEDYLAENEDDARGNYVLAWVYALQGDKANATAAFKKTIELGGSKADVAEAQAALKRLGAAPAESTTPSLTTDEAGEATGEEGGGGESAEGYGMGGDEDGESGKEGASDEEGDATGNAEGGGDGKGGLPLLPIIIGVAVLALIVVVVCKKMGKGKKKGDVLDDGLEPADDAEDLSAFDLESFEEAEE